MKLTVYYTGGQEHSFGGVTEHYIGVNAKGKETLFVLRKRKISKGVYETTETAMETEYLAAMLVRDGNTTLLHRFKNNVKLDVTVERGNSLFEKQVSEAVKNELQAKLNRDLIAFFSNTEFQPTRNPCLELIKFGQVCS